MLEHQKSNGGIRVEGSLFVRTNEASRDVKLKFSASAECRGSFCYMILKIPAVLRHPFLEFLQCLGLLFAPGGRSISRLFPVSSNHFALISSRMQALLSVQSVNSVVVYAVVSRSKVFFSIAMRFSGTLGVLRGNCVRTFSSKLQSTLINKTKMT